MERCEIKKKGRYNSNDKRRILNDLEQYNANTIKEVILDKQNKVLIAKLSQQQSLIHSLSNQITNLDQENEIHLKNIETLVKQIELYKLKSPIDIEKRLNMEEIKYKKEAEKYRTNNSYLNETIRVKDEQIKKLKNDIHRLTIDNKNLNNPASEGNIQNVELRIVIDPGRKVDCNRIFNSDIYSIMQVNILQAKKIDQFIISQNLNNNQSLQELEEYKQDLEKQINKILTTESTMKSRFKELVKVVEDLLENSPSVYAIDTSRKIDRLVQVWNNEDKFSISTKKWKLPKEVEDSNGKKELLRKEFTPLKEIFNKVVELTQVGYIDNAITLWKEVDYSLPEVMEKEEALRVLQIICRFKDKLLLDMQKKVQDEIELREKVKLKGEGMLELMTDYEELNSKYIYATTIENKQLENKIKELQAKIKVFENEIEEKDKFLLNKPNKITLVEDDIKVLNNFRASSKKQEVNIEKVLTDKAHMVAMHKENDNMQEIIKRLTTKCHLLENEVLAAREYHFQYEKQKEELAAQHNTIEALEAKVIRLTERLKNQYESSSKLTLIKFNQ